jgi:predicted ATPase
LSILSYCDGGIAGVDQALREAREINEAATLLYALLHTMMIFVFSGNYTSVGALLKEQIILAKEKDALGNKISGSYFQACLDSATEKLSDAVERFTSREAHISTTGVTFWKPYRLSLQARVQAELGNFDDGRLSIEEAISTGEKTQEKWSEAEILRVADDIELILPEYDAKKAETYFARALEIARAQRAKSWELRAATSLARLWRDQGKRAEARELLAPVYGWFTEGFGTRNLKEAKAQLGALASGCVARDGIRCRSHIASIRKASVAAQPSIASRPTRP